MGHSWSSHAPKLHDGGARIEITEYDALTVCEDGDLLLVREQGAHAALRVMLDAYAARDIAHMQHGQFPTQRITKLPAAVFVRLILCMPNCSICRSSVDEFAIRRLKNHCASDFFRTLVAEITALGPSFEWRSFGKRDLPMALAHDHSAATAQLPLCVTALMKRALSLLQESIALVNTAASSDSYHHIEGSKGFSKTTNSQTSHAIKQQSGHNDSPTPVKADAKPPGSIDNVARLATIDGGNAHVQGYDQHETLSACFVVAAYEHAGIMAPIQWTSAERRPISPGCFWTGAAINNSSSNSGDTPASECTELLPKDTLGHEMYLS
ncbi:hypothetical protein FI667_g5987, partial [Globisporangium splendens]